MELTLFFIIFKIWQDVRNSFSTFIAESYVIAYKYSNRRKKTLVTANKFNINSQL